MGMGSALFRHDAAYVAAWESGVKRVAEALEVDTAAELEQKWPAWAEAMRRAEARLEEAATFNSRSSRSSWLTTLATTEK